MGPVEYSTILGAPVTTSGPDNELARISTEKREAMEAATVKAMEEARERKKKHKHQWVTPQWGEWQATRCSICRVDRWDFWGGRIARALAVVIWCCALLGIAIGVRALLQDLGL